MSRRQENVVDAPSLIPAKGSPAQTIDLNVQGNGASDSLNPSQTQAAPIDLKKRSTSVPNA
jgi:hypothetical protein